MMRAQMYMRLLFQCACSVTGASCLSAADMHYTKLAYKLCTVCSMQDRGCTYTASIVNGVLWKMAHTTTMMMMLRVYVARVLMRAVA